MSTLLLPLLCVLLPVIIVLGVVGLVLGIGLSILYSVLKGFGGIILMAIVLAVIF